MAANDGAMFKTQLCCPVPEMQRNFWVHSLALRERKCPQKEQLSHFEKTVLLHIEYAWTNDHRFDKRHHDLQTYESAIYSCSFPEE